MKTYILAPILCSITKLVGAILLLNFDHLILCIYIYMAEILQDTWLYGKNVIAHYQIYMYHWI